MRVTRHDNYRVEVTPEDPRSHFGFAAKTPQQQHAIQVNDIAVIVRAIQRHIDDYGQAIATWDSYTSCSFCDEREEFPDLPGCCEAAQLEWLQANPNYIVSYDDRAYVAELRAKLTKETT